MDNKKPRKHDNRHIAALIQLLKDNPHITSIQEGEIIITSRGAVSPPKMVAESVPYSKKLDKPVSENVLDQYSAMKNKLMSQFGINE